MVYTQLHRADERVKPQAIWLGPARTIATLPQEGLAKKSACAGGLPPQGGAGHHKLRLHAAAECHGDFRGARASGD